MRYSVPPGDVQDAFETAHVKGVQAAFLSGVSDPRLATVEESAENAGLVDTHLGVFCGHLVLPHLFDNLAMDLG